MQHSGDEMEDAEGPSDSYVPCPCKKCECAEKPTIRLLSTVHVHIAKYRMGEKYKVRTLLLKTTIAMYMLF